MANHLKKELEIFQRLKTDIPFDESEFRQLGRDKLIERIASGDIQIILLETTNLDITLYFPKEKPINYSYKNNWHHFSTMIIPNLKKRIAVSGYPLMYGCSVWIDSPLSKPNICKFCGKQTDKTAHGKENIFCSDECRLKYRQFWRLLDSMEKHGIISKFEMDLRVSRYDILGDTRNDSAVLLDYIRDTFYDEDLPTISTCLYVVDNDIRYGRYCKNCNELFFGNIQAVFCCKHCRDEYRNNLRITKK